MRKSPRCLFNTDIKTFLDMDKDAIFGLLNQNSHGDIQTTSREAWQQEIEIMQTVLAPWANFGGQIIFEYDIPRLGKRIDVVLLLQGVIFCLEFKVGQSKILEADIDQALDYALDLKNFHKFSEDRIIVPILIATKYKGYRILTNCIAIIPTLHVYPNFLF